MLKDQIQELKQDLLLYSDDDNEDNKSKIKKICMELDDLEKKLNGILDQETAGLIVRSRIKWAEHGEKSSKYFCNLENRNNEKKTIRQVRLNNGNIEVNSDKILQEVGSYFESLYSSDCLEADNETASCFLSGLDLPLVSENDRFQLNSPITKAEIWSTLKSMASNKTPGLDGLPVKFYVVFFNDIIDLLLKSYEFSYTNGILFDQSQRNGVITLLPKEGKDPLFVKNYRPISLLNVDYKLIAKVMSNRLKKSYQLINRPRSTRISTWS